MASVPVFAGIFGQGAKSPGRGRTILNALRVRFAHKQRKNYFKFAMLENLRIFQHCLFTGGGVAARLYHSTKRARPSQALTRQIPLFVTCGDIFPRSGGSLSSKGEPSRKACC